MATLAKRKDRVHNCISTIALDGALTSSVRVKLVTEFLKDIMYQRQQIPMPHSQIVRYVNAQQKKQQENLNKPGGWMNQRRGVQMRKEKLYVQHMSEVISTLEQVFTSAVLVRRVLILIGSTTVSPKESYLIQFPTSLYSGKILSLGHCKAQLFKELLASPFFAEVCQPKSCAKVYILVEISEDYTSDLPIIPKPGFKLPRRGSRLSLHFLYPNGGSVEEWSKLNDTEFDISGVEPLNGSVLSEAEMPLKRSFIKVDISGAGTECEHSSHSTPCCPLYSESGGRNHVEEPGLASAVCRCETPVAITNTSPNQSIYCNPYDLTQSGYLWYQLPTCIQGYKDKTTKPISM